MNFEEYTVLLISDFNMDNFAGYLNHDEDAPRVHALVAPYGQVVQALAQQETKLWERDLDCCVVWTRPQGVIQSFKRLLMHEQVPVERVLEEVDNYAALLLEASHQVKSVFVPIWLLPTYCRGRGMIDMQNQIGLANTLMRMNLRLADSTSAAPNIYLLNAQKWVEKSGLGAFAPKLWYMSKIAFGNKVFVAAVDDLKTALKALGGGARKLLVVDLDNTLWGDVVGDVGWEKIKLGGHDHTGEAFADFQRALKSLSNRGVVLGIVSKNQESVALEAIQKHPEMVLGLDDFAGWRINWQDKAQNVVDLVAELNMGLQSTVFIDDDPVERTRVREALPEVLVLEWPKDPTAYASTLSDLPCFDVAAISEEDSMRAGMYTSERKRREEKKKILSLDEWLHTLDLKVRIEKLGESSLSRAAQLLNKTNQMNLTTRRLTELELAAWTERENHVFWVVYVADKFGDSGLSGIASLEVQECSGKIVDFILSCRAMGRKIEAAMLHHLIQQARSMALKEVYADYVQTPRNKPCLELFSTTLSLAEAAHQRFYWDLARDFPLPSHVEITA